MANKKQAVDLPRVHANPEYERYLLGSILLENQEAESAFERVTPEMFFHPHHAKIYQAMLALRERKEAVNAVAVWDFLSLSGEGEVCGGVKFLAALSDDVPRVHSLEPYILTIQKHFRIRRYAHFIESARQMLETESISEEAFLQATAEGISRLSQDLEMSVDVGKTYYDAGIELLVSLDAQTAVRITIGINEVDELIGGFLPGELVIVTADTGVGKTIMAQQCRRIACERGWHTLYCSGEMLARHLVGRDVASSANVPHWKMRMPDRIHEAERSALIQAIDHLCKQCRILESELTVTRIRAAARALKRKVGLELIVIDYDELVEVPGKDEWEQQKNLARAAKALAMELGCCVILVSQLRKALQGEDCAHPTLQRLYGSGAKAKHASIVIFVDREYVRNLTGDETQARICVLKSRDGRVGRVDCRFNIRTLRFENGPATDGNACAEAKN